MNHTPRRNLPMSGLEPRQVRINIGHICIALRHQLETAKLGLQAISQPSWGACETLGEFFESCVPIENTIA